MKSTRQSLLGRCGPIHPAHKRIAVAAAWVALFVLIGKIAAAAREMAIAYRFGTSSVVDAYELAITLTTWGPLALVSVLSIIGVPLFVSLHRANEHARLQFARELTGLALAFGCAFSIFAVSAAYWVLPVLGAGLSVATLSIAKSLTISLAVIAPLILLASIYSVRIMAREKHTNTLVEGTAPAVITLLVILWPDPSTVHALLWGTILGYMAQLACMRQAASSTGDRLGMPKFSLKSYEWRDISRGIGVMTAGQLIMSLVVFLDQYAAATVGDSAIATLGYANRVLTLFLGIGAMAVARAALPVFADLRTSENHDTSWRLTMKWTALMFGLGAVGAGLGWILAPLGIELLYERGAFTTQDTVQVTRVFRFGLIQVPFYFSGLVLLQLLASARRFATIALVATGNFVVKLAANMWLVEHLGVAGITLASGVMYIFSMVAFLFLTVRLRA